MAGDGEDKTEAPSGRRLQKARDEGNIPVSREVATLVSLGVLAVALSTLLPGIALGLAQRLSLLLARAGRIDMSDHGAMAIGLAGRALLSAALPIVLLAGAAGVSATMLQTGFVFHPDRLLPDLSRLDPRRGLKRLFGVTNLIELGKSLLKVIAAGAVCWSVLRAAVPGLQQISSLEAGAVLARMHGQVLQVLFRILALQAVIGLGDFAWVRYRHHRDLRMTRFDLRQENKDSDGDPRVKRRLRQIRALRARQRMREGVRRATVVVTNPTHYAIALQYDNSKNIAPVVVAKGMDSMAARIREMAREFGVPLMANPPLARALYQAELDAPIPPEHYRAVAELIAYVWRLRRGPAA